MKPLKTPLATVDCTNACGEKMHIFRNSLGNLYTRCPICGCSQANGRAPQQVMWDALPPDVSATITPPKCLKTPIGVADPAPTTPEAAPAPIGEPQVTQPEAAPPIGVQESVKPEPTPIGVAETKYGMKGGLIAICVAAIIGGLCAL